MNRLFAILALLFTGTLLTAVPAHASTSCSTDASPGIVTKWEFNHIDTGMTRHRVECIFGTTPTEAHFNGGISNMAVATYPATNDRIVTLLYRINFDTGTQRLVEKTLS